MHAVKMGETEMDITHHSRLTIRRNTE